MGWSNEILPLLARNRNLKAIIPASGTSIWSDVWVKPKTKNGKNKLSESAKKWIEFCWQTQGVDLISLFADGTSPMISTINQSDLSEDVQNNEFLLLEKPELFEKCEFLEPLSDDVEKTYLSLWKEIRKGQL